MMYEQMKRFRRKQTPAGRCVRDYSYLTAIIENYGIKYTDGIRVKGFYT